MPLTYQKWIVRGDLRSNPDKVYVFGDNVIRQGLGGQAKEMRGEPNAIGVVTKWAPDMRERSFFRDDEPRCRDLVTDDMAKVYAMLMLGKTVVVPEDGIGTGLSQLPTRAPKLDALIKSCWRMMETFPR